jgi:streptogramin lyase
MSTPTAAVRERMSRVDIAWLRMDNDVNLMMIVGVWLLRPKIAYETLCRRVEDKLLRYERFGCKVVRDVDGAKWCTDETFDIHRHVVREKLRRRRGQSERAALQERVAALASEPLDPDRPLWQFRLIEDYDGGSAMIARIHHCIGDGIALTSVMMSITDGGNDPPPPRKARASDDAGDWLADLVLKPLGRLTTKAAAVVVLAIPTSPHTSRALGMSSVLGIFRTTLKATNAGGCACSTALMSGLRW